nr:VWA domain-containing protein [Chloroflexota bacterium]
MRSRGVFPLLVFLLSLMLAPLGALADGVIVVDPPHCDFECHDPFPIGDQLEVRSHRVDVTIADQVAATKIDQVFYNPNDWVAEGTYLFPIPKGATVSDFTMWVDGEPIEAKILDAEEARRVYDDIVRQLRDPALLEYAGQGAIQASVFPIPPGEERRIEIEYAEVLTVRDGLVRYVYPLNTERFSAQPLEQVSVRVAVESRDPVRAIYSPSHDIAIDRDGELAFVAGWEAAGTTPATDFELYYSLSAERISTSLLSTYDEATGEGFFLFLAAPGIETGGEIIAKDVIVVLDTSGSMEGDKIVQAKSAVTYILEHLNPEDRFALVEFSTGDRIYSQS